MESLFIQLRCINQFWKIDPYDWVCGPGSYLSDQVKQWYCEIFLWCKITFLFNIYLNVIYSYDAKQNFQHHYCNMLICSTLNTSYYQCWNSCAVSYYYGNCDTFSGFWWIVWKNRFYLELETFVTLVIVPNAIFDHLNASFLNCINSY